MMYWFLLVINVYDFVVFLWHDLESNCYVGISKYYYFILWMCILCPINITMIHDVSAMIDIMIECMMPMDKCECNMSWYM